MCRAFQRFVFPLIIIHMKHYILSIILLFTTVVSSWAGVRSIYVPEIPETKEKDKATTDESEEYRKISCSQLCSVPSSCYPFECDFATCPFIPLKEHECIDMKKTLYLSPNVQTFVRDAEYFLPYTKGYTALGFFLKPTLTYRHNEHLSASVGIDLMGIAGDHKKIRGISPIVTIEYSPIKNITIIGGTLTNLGHQLNEPMWDRDRQFYAHKEDGLQVCAHAGNWSTEMWCNWEDFIVVGSPWQEKFTFGWNNLFRFHPEENNNTIEIPIQLMMNHRGGQIDAVEDTCIETLANACIALRYIYINTTNKWWCIAELPFYGFSNRSNEEHIHTHFKDGWGVYPQIKLGGSITGRKHKSSNYLSGSVGFWYGDGFISGRGSYLFQSRSYFDETYERRYRHMVTAHLLYNLDSILGFGLSAYYDLDENGVDYAATIQLSFDKKFKIHTWK